MSYPITRHGLVTEFKAQLADFGNDVPIDARVRYQMVLTSPQGQQTVHPLGEGSVLQVCAVRNLGINLEVGSHATLLCQLVTGGALTARLSARVTFQG